MISTFLFVFFAIAFFSAESLVSTIVGGAVAFGATHIIKNSTGLQGAGAALLAMVVSIMVAVIAYVLSTLLSGGDISWQMIPQGATQIFTLATLAYKLFMADNSGQTA